MQQSHEPCSSVLEQDCALAKLSYQSNLRASQTLRLCFSSTIKSTNISENLPQISPFHLFPQAAVTLVALLLLASFSEPFPLPQFGLFLFSLPTLSGSLSSFTQLCLPLFLPPQTLLSVRPLMILHYQCQSITFFLHLFSENTGGEEAAQSQNLL